VRLYMASTDYPKTFSFEVCHSDSAPSDLCTLFQALNAPVLDIPDHMQVSRVPEQFVQFQPHQIVENMYFRRIEKKTAELGFV
jgi:hypothetical protein